MALIGWMLDLIALALWILHLFVVRDFLYWKDKGILYLPPLPFVGSLLPLVCIRDSPADFMQRIHRAAGTHPYLGFFIFGRPALLVRDPRILQHILVKDFSNFTDRLTSSDKVKDPVGAGNLFCLKSTKWRKIRAKLTPTFSTSRLKIMFQRVLQSAEQTCSYIQQQEGKPINVKTLFTKSAQDSNCLTLFGINSCSLENPNSEFWHYGKMITHWTPYRALEILAHFFYPPLIRVLNAKLFHHEGTKFLTHVFSEAITEREGNGSIRCDLVDALVNLKKEGFSDAEVLGQALLIFIAGYDTTSSTIAFSMYELAVHTEVQRKLRSEIKSVLAKHGNTITYEALKDMVYLDMVVSEVLRMYPVMAFIDRVSVQDYHVPGTDIVIESGTPVFVSLMGLQTDPEFHINPQHFDPERFSKDRKFHMTPLSYMPFGAGPRSCVGTRLALISVKLMLVVILQRFWVMPHEKTPVPLVLSPYVLFLKNLGQLPLVFVPHNDDPI